MPQYYTSTDVPLDHFNGNRNITPTTGPNAGPSLAAIVQDLQERAAENLTDIVRMSTAPTLTVGAEAANVIPITFASPVASVEQYIATIMQDSTMEPSTAAFHLAENGAGTEVSPTDRARLIFKTDANGAATLDATDVAGASGATCYVTVEPLFESADVADSCAPVMTSITFD